MSDTLMPVALLAGGLATRLRPMTETIPKSLILINEEPFINYQLKLLQQRGVRNVVICAGFLGEMIQAHVGNGSSFGLNVQYSFDGDKPLGTGGALKRALPLLEERFFVLYGDSLLTCDYASVQRHFALSQKLGLMTIFQNEGQWDTSNIEYVAGQLLVYDKVNRTKNMRHIDYGLGILSKKAFDLVPEDQPIDLAVIYQFLLKDQQMAAYEVSERFYEIGSFAGISELRYHLGIHNCC